MKVSILTLLLVTMGLAALENAALADKITLKDGRVFEGRISSEDENEVQIETKEGAFLSFLKESVQAIDRERTEARAAETSLRKEVRELRKEIKELQDEVAQMREELDALIELQEQLKKTENVVTEVTGRTEQVPGPRGDASEELRLTGVKVRRGGDAIKIEGYITCRSRKAGRWVRIVGEVIGPYGAVESKGYTTPDVSTPGTTVRDLGWVYPGKDVIFNVFIPWGREEGDRDMSPLDVIPGARVVDRLNLTLSEREKRRRVVVRLEIPPRFKEKLEPRPGG